MQITRQKNKEIRIKSAKAFALLALFLMPTLFFPTEISASAQDDLNNINNKIEETNNKINQTKAQEKTLNGQLALFDRQIGSVQAEINKTSTEIVKLNSEITMAKIKIKEAEVELAKNRDYLSEYMRITYEEGQETQLELIAKSNNFSDFVNRSEYLEVMQLKIKTSADAVVKLMNELDQQKNLLEKNKKQTEELKAQQLAQRSGLTSQRSAKDRLLEATKGNEAEYQKLLRKLKQEQAAISAQIKQGLNNQVNYGNVNAGDIIGIMGNSGFSTGCHTHFEIWNSSQNHRNPANYIGNGYFIHPASGARLTAPYGYSSYYFSGVFHTGIDYADGCAGTPIRASADGVIIKRVSGRPNTYPRSYEYGNYVIVYHTNGMYSLYAHLR